MGSGRDGLGDLLADLPAASCAAIHCGLSGLLLRFTPLLPGTRSVSGVEPLLSVNFLIVSRTEPICRSGEVSGETWAFPTLFGVSGRRDDLAPPRGGGTAGGEGFALLLNANVAPWSAVNWLFREELSTSP